jgi:uncharacterized UPF0160 family protein
VRTRDADTLAAADLRVDVGFRDDPATGDFDHHQKGGAGERPNGVRYASFGLVWRAFGAQVCDGDADVAARVDASLVQGVDANDTGQAVVAPIVEGVRPMTVSGVIGGLNRRWDEDLSPEAERARFDAAVSLARGIIEREIASAAAGRRAVRIVEAAVGGARDPRVIELERDVPWKEVVVTQAPDALFVVYPKRQGWGLEAVPREPRLVHEPPRPPRGLGRPRRPRPRPADRGRRRPVRPREAVPRGRAVAGGDRGAGGAGVGRVGPGALHHPNVPAAPLNGPTRSDVIQPP